MTLNRKHALLSSSSAHRWLECTPSARLEDQYPDTAGESAREGTFAHKLAELELERYIQAIGDVRYHKAITALKDGKSPWVTFIRKIWKAMSGNT